MYEDILTLIQSIYSILQEEDFWFKECIKKMNPKKRSKQYNTDPCMLY